jgi:hypothetical protein
MKQDHELTNYAITEKTIYSDNKNLNLQFRYSEERNQDFHETRRSLMGDHERNLAGKDSTIKRLLSENEMLKDQIRSVGQSQVNLFSLGKQNF